jgi:anti-sigma factor RsiW
MKCENVRERLNAFLDHELSEADNDLVRKHLSGCPDCQCELRELQAVNSLLSEFAPNESIDALNSRIRSSVSGHRLSGWSRLAVAASFAVVLTGGFLMGKSYNNTSTSTATATTSTTATATTSTTTTVSFGQESLYTYFNGEGQ